MGRGGEGFKGRTDGGNKIQSETGVRDCNGIERFEVYVTYVCIYIECTGYFTVRSVIDGFGSVGFDSFRCEIYLIYTSRGCVRLKIVSSFVEIVISLTVNATRTIKVRLNLIRVN